MSMTPWDDTGNAAGLADLDAFWLGDAGVPRCLLDPARPFVADDADDLARVDIMVSGGIIARVEPAGVGRREGEVVFDLDGGQVWPCFVDMHTHLDKGHIWPRMPNPDGSFMGALEATATDREARWAADDVRARMEFSLRCAYAHGTRAIRTHLDSTPPQHGISWPVFAEMRDRWAGRIELQAATILGLDRMEPGIGEEIVQTVVEHSGVLGAVTEMDSRVGERLRWMCRQADEHGLDLDLHVDESLDPNDRALEAVADAVIDTGFQGTVTCGHCCALSVLPDDAIDRTLDKVAEANLAIVSLPMCNMFLQDRQSGRTPQRRGVTLLHEMKARGIRIAIASDNTRDPFYGYGDMDGLEVFTQAVRIAHLDRPIGDWPLTLTNTPAAIMGLASPAAIMPDGPADLILFKGRGYSELLSRPQGDRIVLRDGKPIDTTPPDFRDLDHLM